MFYVCCGRRETMFSFKVEQLNGLREELEYLLRKYKVGTATIRKVRALANGRVLYYVDVENPSAEGLDLLRWLRDGRHYDQERRNNANFPPELHGPVWVTETIDGVILRRWWLHGTSTVE